MVALGFLERDHGIYSNTPSTEMFLDKRKPSYIGGILEMANHRLYGFWGGLTEALRTGQLQNEAKSGEMPFFEALYADPARLKEFLAAMTGISQGANMQIARKFSWHEHETFVDVGTAQGDLAVKIALANDHVTGLGFDLPEVAPIFEDYVEQDGLQTRLSFAAGDFFTDDLPEADVLVMGHILHDWGLDEKRTLIGKAYEVLPEGGALIVYGRPAGADALSTGAGSSASGVESCSSQGLGGLVLLIEEPGALSPPAGAVLSLLPPARLLPRRESGDLLDALAGLPQRADGPARLRRAPSRYGDARPPAGARVCRRRLPRDDRVRRPRKKRLPLTTARPPESVCDCAHLADPPLEARVELCGPSRLAGLLAAFPAVASDFLASGTFGRSGRWAGLERDSLRGETGEHRAPPFPVLPSLS